MRGRHVRSADERAAGAPRGSLLATVSSWPRSSCAAATARTGPGPGSTATRRRCGTGCKLLLLPMAVAVLPIWASREARLDRRVKAAALAVVGVFVLVVLAGYLIPWRWTGFVGNNLWDWLNLVALPVAVALIPVARELRRDWSARHTAISVAGLAVRPRSCWAGIWPAGGGPASRATRCGSGCICCCCRCCCRP